MYCTSFAMRSSLRPVRRKLRRPAGLSMRRPCTQPEPHLGGCADARNNQEGETMAGCPRNLIGGLLFDAGAALLLPPAASAADTPRMEVDPFWPHCCPTTGS